MAGGRTPSLPCIWFHLWFSFESSFHTCAQVLSASSHWEVGLHLCPWTWMGSWQPWPTEPDRVMPCGSWVGSQETPQLPSCWSAWCQLWASLWALSPQARRGKGPLEKPHGGALMLFSFDLFPNLSGVFKDSYCCLFAKSCLTLCDPMDCGLPGSYVHQILLAGILEWLLFPSSEELPNLGIEFMSPTLAGGFFTTEPPGKPPF